MHSLIYFAGVIINNVDYTLRSSQPLQASTPNNVLTFDFVANSLPSAASVSGQNLWQVSKSKSLLMNLCDVPSVKTVNESEHFTNYQKIS